MHEDGPPPVDEDNPLPVHAEAEQALLGALLYDNQCFDQVGDILSVDHFAFKEHRNIYRVVSQMIERGRTADLVSITKYCQAHGAMENVGGTQYLANLLASVPSVHNVRDYAELVIDWHVRREGILACQEGIAKLRNQDIDLTGREILEQTEAHLQGLSEESTSASSESAAAVLGQVVEEIEQRRAGGGTGLSGLSTGLYDLDRATSGLTAPDLIILAGRPSMGKTVLALNIGKHVAMKRVRTTDDGGPVLFFSKEMGKKALGRRLLAEDSGITLARLKLANDLTQLDIANLRDCQARLRDLPLEIDDSSGLTIQAMTTRARRMQRKRGLALVIADHLGYIKPSIRTGNTAQDIGHITKGAKAMAKTLGVPVILLCQLSRGTLQREGQRPDLGDLRNSGEIEEDADLVWFIHREHYYLSRQKPPRKPGDDDNDYKERVVAWEASCRAVETKAELILGKNRDGAPQYNIQLYFDGPVMRFRSLRDDDG